MRYFDYLFIAGNCASEIRAELASAALLFYNGAPMKRIMTDNNNLYIHIDKYMFFSNAILNGIYK